MVTGAQFSDRNVMFVNISILGAPLLSFSQHTMENYGMGGPGNID